MSQCVKCNQNVYTDVFECSLCSGIFHTTCATPHSLDVAGRVVEGCLRCFKDDEKRKISLLNASKPAVNSQNIFSNEAQSNVTHYCVRPSFLQSETILNMSPKTSSKSNPSAITEDSNDLLKSLVEKVNCLPTLIAQMESLNSKMSNVEKLKNDLSEINNKLGSFIENCKTNTEDIVKINVRLSRLETNSNHSPPADIGAIKRDLEFSMSRTYEIIIIGLTAKLLSNKDETLKKLAKHLNIFFVPWHVSSTHIIKPRNNNNSQTNNSHLIVRFISPSFRGSWLKAKRLKGNIKCSDIDKDQPENLIFINERQTAKERQELLKAKRECDSRGYHGCWMSDGKILFKKLPEGRVFVYKHKPAPSTQDEDMEITHSLHVNQGIADTSQISNSANIPAQLSGASSQPTLGITLPPSTINQPNHGSTSV